MTAVLICQRARNLNLRGWVRNNPDSSVEGVAVGDTQQIKALCVRSRCSRHEMKAKPVPARHSFTRVLPLLKWTASNCSKIFRTQATTKSSPPSDQVHPDTKSGTRGLIVVVCSLRSCGSMHGSVGLAKVCVYGVCYIFSLEPAYELAIPAGPQGSG